MPELPEVETIRRQLDPMLAGRAITRADAHPSAKFAEDPGVPQAASTVFAAGKYLILDLDDDRDS